MTQRKGNEHDVLEKRGSITTKITAWTGTALDATSDARNIVTTIQQLNHTVYRWHGDRACNVQTPNLFLTPLRTPRGIERGTDAIRFRQIRRGTRISRFRSSRHASTANDHPTFSPPAPDSPA
ncbi:unnamed protein product [Ectocarpus sp. 12 AP-2014]